MKPADLVIIALVLVGFTRQENVQQETQKAAETPMLTGILERSDLNQEPYQAWYVREYEGYALNASLLDTLKGAAAGVEVQIFLGTWCSDSHREVPRFYKIIDMIGIPEQAIRLVALDRAKTSPVHEEEGLNIHHVPTFIFYWDTVEIGRIIETPVRTLEEDLLDILTSAVYVPNYSELE